MHEDITKGRDDAGGHYKREGCCRRALQKVEMVQVQKKNIIKERDGAGGRYRRERCCRRTL